MRAMLCLAGENGVSGRVEGAGIAGLSKSPAAELFGATDRWTRKHGKLDLLLGGMVGSDIGWRTTPYVACPMEPTELASQLVTFDEAGHRVAVVPGVRCTNRLGQPDFMRGEEIQILGWMRSNPAVRDAILCLPGTHVKWVRIRNGRIEGFTTSLTGELYDLLVQRSVLVPAVDRDSVCFDKAAMAKGVEVAAAHGDHILHALFSTRSNALADPSMKDNASSYLSGLLIGSDVRSAMAGIEPNGDVVELIGARALCERFALALERMGYESNSSDGDDMSLAGFLEIAEATR